MVIFCLYLFFLLCGYPVSCLIWIFAINSTILPSMICPKACHGVVPWLFVYREWMFILVMGSEVLESHIWLLLPIAPMMYLLWRCWCLICPLIGALFLENAVDAVCLRSYITWDHAVPLPCTWLLSSMALQVLWPDLFVLYWTKESVVWEGFTRSVSQTR